MLPAMKRTLWATDRRNRFAVALNETDAENTVGYVSHDDSGHWGFIEDEGEILSKERFESIDRAAAALVNSLGYKIAPPR